MDGKYSHSGVEIIFDIAFIFGMLYFCRAFESIRVCKL